MTGIDRVELAYLDYFLRQTLPVWALVRTALGFVLLDRTGMQGVFDRAVGQVPIGKPDVLGLLTQRHLPQHLRAEADARRLSVARCVGLRLGAMLRAHLPAGTVYVNVGHANLTDRLVRAVKAVSAAQMIIMVHDTIPLEYPQFCRAEVSAGFAKKLALVAGHADRVVHTAAVTRATTEAHFADCGRVPAGITAPLGVTAIAPNAATLAGAIRPYYVVLGTIEPRKNIELLVKVWRILLAGQAPVPHLYVIGNRGWADAALFADLQALVATSAASVLNNAADPVVAALLHGAEALLFPSLAEGYALPPIEAAALGVPVIAGKLPVVVERLGDYPVYLDTSDVYVWVDAISQQIQKNLLGQNVNRQTRLPPNWADHFDLVFGES